MSETVSKPMRGFTQAQQRALLALPRDGSRLINTGSLSRAISSLCLYHKDLAVREYGVFGPRGGYKVSVRLTDAGRDFIAQHLPELL